MSFITNFKLGSTEKWLDSGHCSPMTIAAPEISRGLLNYGSTIEVASLQSFIRNYPPNSCA